VRERLLQAGLAGGAGLGGDVVEQMVEAMIAGAGGVERTMAEFLIETLFEERGQLLILQAGVLRFGMTQWASKGHDDRHHEDAFHATPGRGFRMNDDDDCTSCVIIYAMNPQETDAAVLTADRLWDGTGAAPLVRPTIRIIGERIE